MGNVNREYNICPPYRKACTMKRPCGVDASRRQAEMRRVHPLRGGKHAVVKRGRPARNTATELDITPPANIYIRLW